MFLAIVAVCTSHSTTKYKLCSTSTSFKVVVMPETLLCYTMHYACLQACTFCGPVEDAMAAGLCITADQQCPSSSEQQLQAYTSGCPSHYNWLIIGSLMLYLAAFSPGMGPVPWAVNAEIYPVQVTMLCSVLSDVHKCGGKTACGCSSALDGFDGCCLSACTKWVRDTSLCL